MGNSAFKKIQVAFEDESGTHVPAYLVLRMVADYEDLREVKLPKEDVAILTGTDRSYVSKLSAKLDAKDSEATFEQFIIPLLSSVSDTTPTKDGIGSGQVWLFLPSVKSVKTLKTMSIEGGDDTAVEVGSYFFCTDWKLSGKAGESMKFSFSCLGRTMDSGSFTADIELTDVEEILFSRGALYIDNVTGTIGTTKKSSTFLSYDATYKSGYEATYTGDGELYFDHITFNRDSIDFTQNVIFIHDSSAVAEKNNWKNQVPRQMRVEWTGSPLTTAGTHTNKLLRIDSVGKWTKFSKLDVQNGNDVVTGTLVAKYNKTVDMYAKFMIVNEISTLENV